MADPDHVEAVRQEQQSAINERNRRRELIHQSFPTMGQPRASSEGSQSNAPMSLTSGMLPEPHWGYDDEKK